MALRIGKSQNQGHNDITWFLRALKLGKVAKTDITIIRDTFSLEQTRNEKHVTIIN